MAGRFAPRNAPRTPVPRQVPTGPAPEALTRDWTPPGPLDLRLVLGPLRRGPADPTFRIDRDGSVWRATRTPAGPGTLHIIDRGGRIEATAWGPGASWLLDQLPTLLGAEDDPEAFRPRHRLVAAARHRRPGLRLLRTGLVLESLIPSILEQKVTTDEAYRAWRILVRTYGTPAPGPAATLFGTHGLHVMPDPRTWSLIPSWEWHRAGCRRQAVGHDPARGTSRPPPGGSGDDALPEATARLELIPGIGPWTSAETLQRANGAPDAVTVGDLHLPGIIGHALAGNRNADDEEMLTLLTPYEGQRHRATRLILLSGHTPSRRAPRMTRGDIARL